MPEKEARSGTGGGPRPFWSGTIAFGLVSVPVSLLVAYRGAGVSLRMVDQDGVPLQRRYFCSVDEQMLTADDIVRGYEVEPERYVAVEDEELQALAPEKSQEIDLKRFVARSDVDPVYFERAYFLAPDRRAIKAYRLLAHAMEESGRAGIATFVMRGKEYLVAILSSGGILRAETLRFHDELRSPADVGLPELAPAQERRAQTMMRAMEALAADAPDGRALEDDGARRMQTLVERKLEAGEDVVSLPEDREAPEPEGGEVVDLMEVLKRSLEGSAPSGAKDEGGGAQRAAPLERRTKAQLYARARELDIGGRSNMTRDQLIAAIREAG